VEVLGYAGERAIEVELDNTAFRRLVVDMADPTVEVARLQALIAPSAVEQANAD
jgi:hypothetical protein